VADDFKERFLAERARALATVILTRRADLTVAETKDDTGLDYHVYISREGKPVRAMFGVLLRAVMAPVTADEANKLLAPALDSFRRMGRFTYPVCLFFFTMRDDHAFFCWLAEPVLATDGSPRLLHHRQAHCRDLDDEALDAIVRRVVSWYDALDAELVTERPGRSAEE
jgi:hypothetical protein